ncbi:MAG: hypothetical protein K2V38_00880 [Gemmataceae bacterium]|nr:hypothetical protein [Gemmataceae bacterium]
MTTPPTTSVPASAPSAEALKTDVRAQLLKRALEAQKAEAAAVLQQLETKGRVVDLRA